MSTSEGRRPLNASPRSILGAAQAEADTGMLRRAFLETADYQALRRTTDFNYVVGRRGTGKSALCDRLNEEWKQDKTIITIVEEPQEFEMLELQHLLSSFQSDYRTLRAISRLLWTSVFLRTSALALSKHYTFFKSSQAAFLNEYLSGGSSSPMSSTAECIRTLRSMISSKIPAEEMPSSIATRYSVARVTDAIREALRDMDLRIVVMYDRLDEAWIPEMWAVAILGGLAKMAADYREKHMNVYPILFIIDNMFRMLAHLDDDFTRHVEGHTLRLRWDEASLFHFVVARLRVALNMEEVENEQKVWNRFAARGLQGRDGFGKCLQHTLYRPRDILVLLNEAFVNAQRDQRSEVVEDDVTKSATQISQIRLDDLCKEYDKVLPGLRLCVASFHGQSASRTVAEAAAHLDALVDAGDILDPRAGDLALFSGGAELASALHSVGFLGVRDDSEGTYAFCHDGSVNAKAALSPERATIIHPCYWRALELTSPTADDVVIQVNDEYKPGSSEEEQQVLRLKRLGRVPEELARISDGPDHSKKFESWVHSAIRILFSGSLANIQLKPNPVTALNQRDIVATNAKKVEPWIRIHEDYESRQIVFECKNYQELTPDDIRQVLDYLTGEYGRCGFIVRKGPDALSPAEKERVKAAYHEHKRLVIIVPASLLMLCIRKLRTPKKYDYAGFVMSRHIDDVVRNTLSQRKAERIKGRRVR